MVRLSVYCQAGYWATLYDVPLLCFSVLTGSYDNTVRIWNTEGDCSVTIPAHSGPVKCVRWLKNGKVPIESMMCMTLNVLTETRWHEQQCWQEVMKSPYNRLSFLAEIV